MYGLASACGIHPQPVPVVRIGQPTEDRRCVKPLGALPVDRTIAGHERYGRYGAIQRVVAGWPATSLRAARCHAAHAFERRLM